MRNFFRFLRRFSNLLLFLALEAVCFVLIARTRTLQGDEVLSAANTVVGFVYNRQNAIAYYFSLKVANEQLVAENARLRQQLSETRYSVDTLHDSLAMRPLPPAPNDTLTKVVRYAKYTYRSARVINNTVTEVNNYLTLNRGAKDGIRPGMAVITSNGVVGKVAYVSDHFASVLSVLSQIQRVSGQLPDGTAGFIGWKEKGNPGILYMNDVPPEVPVKKGDSVLTTTYSFFPPGVLIGTVHRILLVKSTNKRILELRPGANFRNLQFVYVVENSLALEQQALEAQKNKQTEKRGKK